jgi:predicted kinase
VSVIVLRGVPGSGKSTLAKRLQPDPKFIYSADDYFKNPITGIYEFDRNKLGQAHGMCLRRFNFDALLGWNQDVLVVDNTNTTAIEVAPYAALALAYGHNLKVITILTEVQPAFERNIHQVPLKSIKPMNSRLYQSKNKLPEYWNEVIINDINHYEG